jgi:hypothetical protein
VFGLSLSKILITILIIIAIWKGFTLINRLANERRAAVKKRPTRPARQNPRPQPPGTIELRECPRCGAYVDPREGCRCGERRNEARRANF